MELWKHYCAWKEEKSHGAGKQSEECQVWSIHALRELRNRREGTTGDTKSAGRLKVWSRAVKEV